MAVASPRLFLALRLSSPSPPLTSFISVSLSLPVCSPIVLIVLFVLPLALNPSHTHNLHSCIHIHTCTYLHTYTHTRAKCIPCFRSLCVPSFDPSTSSSLRRPVPSVLLVRSSPRAPSYHIRMSRSENSSVGPG